MSKTAAREGTKHKPFSPARPARAALCPRLYGELPERCENELGEGASWRTGAGWVKR
jgi:hypothetical protein